jgi:hypothetical protein
MQNEKAHCRFPSRNGEGRRSQGALRRFDHSLGGGIKNLGAETVDQQG